MSLSYSKRGLYPEPPPPLSSHDGLPSDPPENPSAPALDAVYRTEAPRLLRYFRQRLRQKDDAIDLVQETFVRLAATLAKGPLQQPGPYLQRIARNLLVDRSKRLENRLSAFHVPIGEGSDPIADPEQGLLLEAGDVMRIYRRALDELPEKTRVVFLLHRVDELTYKEIGVRMGLSIPTIQYHVARALSHIDAALEQE